MNRRFLILFFSLLSISNIVKAEISPNSAQKIANEWFEKAGFEVNRNQVKKAPSLSKEDDNSYYIFNNSNGAYVIISGFDEENPIIGYSKEAEWDFEHVPPFLKEMLGKYGDNFKSGAAIAKSACRKQSTRQGKSVLLRTANWGQGAPYNDMVDNKYPIGCVATAIAIALRYYESPLPGSGVHSYFSPYPNKTYSFDFNRTFDWSMMPIDRPKNGYSKEQAKAISELTFAAAVASDMYFTPTASGGTLWSYSIQKFFNYSQDIMSHRSEFFEFDALKNMLYEELDNDRVILCSGGAHCFVCDGYEDEYFHFNFGWDGYDNGYFTLSDISPIESGHPYVNFTTGIHPAENVDMNGVPWRIARGSSNAKGLCVDAEKIETGKQYNFSVNDMQSQVASYHPHEGEIGLAIINTDNKIREIIYSEELNFCCYYGEYTMFFNNVVINCELKDDDRVVVVARLQDSDNWIIVPVEMGLRSSIIVDETGLKGIPVIWDFSFGKCECNDYNYEFNHQNKNIIFPGFDFCVAITYPEGHSLRGYLLNDIPKGVDSYGFGRFRAEEGIESYTIRPVCYKEDEILSNCEVLNEEGGSVGSCLNNKDDFIRLTEFKVNGIINEDDFKFFNSLPNLKKLDLFDSKVIGSYVDKIPDYAFENNHNIDSLILPESTTLIGYDAFLYSSMKVLHLGSNINKIKQGSLDCEELEKLYVEMPEPIDVIPNLFQLLDLDKIILYVPIGTKRLYETSSYAWSKFKNIVEYDYSASVDQIGLKDEFSFVTDHNRLIVSSNNPTSILVSDLNGRILISEMIDGAKNYLLNPGIYILRTSNNQSYKIAVN